MHTDDNAWESSLQRCAEAIAAVESRGQALGAIERIIPGITEAAAASDDRRAQGRPRGDLDGIPFAVKANIDVAGVPTTSGLVDPDVLPAPSDAFVVDLLRQAGAIPVATTTMAPMAMGATTEHPEIGPCRNPHRDSHHAGGSSGGSGAVVGAGIVPFALGSDTMGSVRIPADYCEVFAWLPTHGSVSSTGMTPLAEPLDNVGVIASNAELLESVAELIRVPDPSDPWSTDRMLPEQERVDHPIIGSCTWLSRAESTRQAAARDLMSRLDAAGCRRVDDIDMSSLDPALLRRRGLALVEAAAAETFASQLNRELIPQQWAGLLEYGRQIDAPRLWRTIRELVSARREIRTLLRPIDILVLPTTPGGAPEVGQDPADAADLTAWVNVAGLPAVVIPWMGSSLQLIGRPGTDHVLIEWAGRLTHDS